MEQLKIENLAELQLNKTRRVAYPEKMEPIPGEPKHNESETGAAAALVLLSIPQTIPQPIDDVINSILNPRTVTLRAEEEFQRRMEESKQAALAELKRADEASRNDNGASQTFRSRRARRKFLLNQMTIQNQKMSQSLDSSISTAKALCSSLLERVKERCDTEIFMELFKKMEKDAEDYMRDRNPAYSLGEEFDEDDDSDDEDDEDESSGTDKRP